MRSVCIVLYGEMIFDVMNENVYGQTHLNLLDFFCFSFTIDKKICESTVLEQKQATCFCMV